MRKIALLVGFIFVVASVSPAAAATAKARGAAGYGSAGCGWGGNVIQKRDFWAQFGAWILNGVSSNQTFAMTSGTSGCSKIGLILAENEQTTFVENNYGSLVREMAAGEGEHLSTLAGLLGCQTGDVTVFGAFTQANYSTIIRSEETTAAEMLVALKNGMSRDQRFSTSCSRA
jgi:hypothetical protein